MLEIGERKFLSIPGDRHHDLPPLLVRGEMPTTEWQLLFGTATEIVDSDELLSETVRLTELEEALERRRLDLAATLLQQYKTFLTQWNWGDSVVEWIRQCEITFDGQPDLKPLLRRNIWPHAGRASFVNLIQDKHREVDVALHKVVGLRLAFRQPPPISCVSEQFLMYLNGAIAESAYEAWANMGSDSASFPPERFDFPLYVM
jgi:hypothetical protein